MTAAKSHPGRSGSSQAIAAPTTARATAWVTEPVRLDAAVLRPCACGGEQRQHLGGQRRRDDAHAQPRHCPERQPRPHRQGPQRGERGARRSDGDQQEPESQPGSRRGAGLDHPQAVQLRARRPGQAGDREAQPRRGGTVVVDGREHQRHERTHQGEGGRDQAAQCHDGGYAGRDAQRPGRQERAQQGDGRESGCGDEGQSRGPAARPLPDSSAPPAVSTVRATATEPATCSVRRSLRRPRRRRSRRSGGGAHRRAQGEGERAPAVPPRGGTPRASRPTR